MKNLRKIEGQDLGEVYGAGPIPAHPCNCFCHINNARQWNPCSQYCPGGEVIPGVEMGNDPTCGYKLPL
jgi:hypothetical protein